MQDATPQTSRQPDAPPRQLPDAGGATQGPDAERPPRKDRRYTWYGRRLKDMEARKEKKGSGDSRAMTSQPSTSSPAGPRKNVQSAVRHPHRPQHGSDGQREYRMRHAQGSQYPVSPGPLYSPSNQPYQPYQRPISSVGYAHGHGQARTRHPGRQQSFRHASPLIVVSPPADPPMQEEDTSRSARSRMPGCLQVSTEQGLLGMDPPTPLGTEQDLLLEDLGPSVEVLEEPVAMPDPASSNSAPRVSSSDWDESTKVPPAGYEGMTVDGTMIEEDAILPKGDESLEERLQLVKNLLAAGEPYLARPLRSQTWGPASSDSYEGWFDCDRTMVDEPIELLSKDDTSGPREMPLTSRKVVDESFASHRSTSWT